jgi:hypothetical protein
MSGSSIVPIIVPIVTVICLAVPIVMVFYADSHPTWKNRSAALRPGRSAPVGERPRAAARGGGDAAPSKHITTERGRAA